ncbi:ly6/PLAUR domain-containing protein 4 isoform X2 [Sciurus carolinensis]|uniref:ly6/PLAUR domain-containing protein 4 isoform X2 n=1 Tax=Sciurus carolinensis TaxID=30640 RepID=UPI001FB26A1A|nr:ly6/PLAUR domain-containing protein 4 isoform X2 [Sciurus carolinensis]XP_047383846.1 ly6/PLAUR domain-containing protein 4 isoform X2 [Sciurus carolinensis]XP_047383847.1 ly6/PLAUR domain-containing protein 4 isoform X2 [Sciurus carolinensis]XP_047383849.1 ly6/PLAUR domain-containing protein 4 isoform X2 [Sciurus carolinensis]
MGPQHLRPVQLLCLLGAISSLPRAGTLLCYQSKASAFRAVTFHNWRWRLMKSMVCKLREGCEETLVLIESGTKRGVLGFKGCSSSLSYHQQVSYLVAPPGVSIASYSRVCRTFLCNNLTNLQPFVELKAKYHKSTSTSSHTCPTCVGEHDKECLPNFVSTEACPSVAPSCFSSTFKFQAGLLNTTFLVLGCTRKYQSLLSNFHHIGSIKVTEVLNIIEKSQIVGAGPSSQDRSWGILLGLLLVFRY